MALRPNPLTGELEEDGLPEDPNALPAGPMGGIAPPVSATGAGGAVPAAPGTTIQIGNTKPEHETQFGSRQLVKGPDSKAADAAAAAAGQKFLAASAAQEGVDQQEGEVKGQGFAEEERRREEAGLDMAALAEQRKRAIQEAIAEDDDQVKQVNKAYKEKNDAEIDYFKGRPAAEIFTALLRGLDRAASSFRGESGPTGVDRVVGEKIAAYKAQKLGEWERAKENRAIKKANAAAYQEEFTRKEIEVNNKLLAGLDVLKARIEKQAAGLTPERAAALRQQRDAVFLGNEAKLKQEREQGYDKLKTFEETRRSPTTSGAAGGEKADDANVYDPETGAALGKAANPAQAKEANTTLASTENIKSDMRRIAEINAKLPKKRNPLDGDVQALESEKDLLIKGLAPKFSQAFGAGAPSTAEFKAYAANADRGYLQDQASFQKQTEQMIANVDRIGRTKARSVGVQLANEPGKQRGPVAAALGEKLAAKGALPAKPATKGPAEGEIVRYGGKTYRMKGGKLQPVK